MWGEWRPNKGWVVFDSVRDADGGRGHGGFVTGQDGRVVSRAQCQRGMLDSEGRKKGNEAGRRRKVMQSIEVPKNRTKLSKERKRNEEPKNDREEQREGPTTQT